MWHYHDYGDVLIHLLSDNRLMQTQEQINHYIFALDRLSLWRSTSLNPRYLKDLFYGLDDDCAHIPPMQHLEAYISHHPPELFVPTLLDVTSLHIDRASGWLNQMYLGLLYGSCLTVAKRTYPHLSDSQKRMSEKVFEDVLKDIAQWEDDQTIIERERLTILPIIDPSDHK